jgi:hypothetical protein
VDFLGDPVRLLRIVLERKNLDTPTVASKIRVGDSCRRIHPLHHRFLHSSQARRRAEVLIEIERMRVELLREADEDAFERAPIP